MSRPFNEERAATLLTKAMLGLLLLLLVRFAVAQNNLGELLDGGAQKVSIDDFKQGVLQRLVVGPTAAGGNIEVMYTQSGIIQGTGSYREGLPVPVLISGEWTAAPDGRVCTSMRIGGQPGATGPPGVMLPPRCQYWFKYKDDYFIADSDTDLKAKVLRRTVKQ